jgi:hypothetical protein
MLHDACCVLREYALRACVLHAAPGTQYRVLGALCMHAEF